MKFSWKWMVSLLIIVLSGFTFLILWKSNDMPEPEISPDLPQSPPSPRTQPTKPIPALSEAEGSTPEPGAAVEKPTPLPSPPPGHQEAEVIPSPDDDEPVSNNRPDEPPAQPPFMGPDGGSMQSSVQDDAIRNMARRIQVDSGPEARKHARSLLQAEGKDLGLVGVALLLEEAEWESDLVEKIENHPDVAVPLYAWQGLRDRGRYSEADALTQALADRMGNLGEQLGQISQAEFPGTAARGLVEFALAADQPEVLEALVLDENADYSGRMSALLALEHELPFEEYRNRVYEELSREAKNYDPVWSEGVRRLAERIEGPAEVHAAERVVVPEDVDILLAREYPATLEDLSLFLENSESREGTRFGPGTVERLQRLQEEAQSRPLSDADRNALQRIAVLAERIEESDISDLPPPTPPMDNPSP